jgi:hypothetical protein
VQQLNIVRLIHSYKIVRRGENRTVFFWNGVTSYFDPNRRPPRKGAGQQAAVMLTMDYLRRQAAAGRREDFEKYLAAVPDAPPVPGDELPEEP